VIGSGATAMTLVPAMAMDGAKVTMVQRSPTYVVSAPSVDRIAERLNRWLPQRWAYAITRFKNIQREVYFYHRTRVAPTKTKKMLVNWVRQALGPDYDVETHFTPRYDPWDQRLCLIPDDDLFNVLNDGSAKLVTAQIDTITTNGVRLDSGEVIDADIVVPATGLKLVVLSEVAFSVDGEPVNVADTYSYKGMMYSGVPNMVQTFGYIHHSWTLRADLTAQYACRLINHMDSLGMRQVTPTLRDRDKHMPALPWIQDFSAGYIQRRMHLFPRQGDRAPWLNTQNYARDIKMIRRAAVADDVLRFTGPAVDRSMSKDPRGRADAP